MERITIRSGEGGIRTHGTDEPYNRFRVCPIQPLSHLSSCECPRILPYSVGIINKANDIDMLNRGHRVGNRPGPVGPGKGDLNLHVGRFGKLDDRRGTATLDRDLFGINHETALRQRLPQSRVQDVVGRNAGSEIGYRFPIAGGNGRQKGGNRLGNGLPRPRRVRGATTDHRQNRRGEQDDRRPGRPQLNCS